MPTPASRPATLAELRASGWQSRTVKEELRANLLARLAADEEVLPTVLGYEETVAAGDRERDPCRPRPGLPGRARPGEDAHGAPAGRPARRVAARSSRGGEINDDPFAPVSPAARAIARARGRRDRHRLAAARPALRREAGHAGRLHRRPDRRGRPDQGGRGSLPVRRADHPLRAHPAGQPRHLRHQRAARPDRADPGRPAQRDGGARRPDPWLHGPPAARPVRRGQRQPGGLHQPRPHHHAAQGPLRLQIRTHYPRTLEHETAIVHQEQQRWPAAEGSPPWSCRRSWRRSSPS